MSFVVVENVEYNFYTIGIKGARKVQFTRNDKENHNLTLTYNKWKYKIKKYSQPRKYYSKQIKYNFKQ